MKCGAFTMIETMLAVLMLALLAAGVTLSLSGPLQTGRADDAAAALAAFDAAARQAAIGAGRPVWMTIDMATGVLVRFEGNADGPAATLSLPSGYHVERVKIGRHVDSVGRVTIEFSNHGWSPSYAVRLVGPRLDKWYAFAGLTGLITEASDETSLPVAPRTPGYDAD